METDQIEVRDVRGEWRDRVSEDRFTVDSVSVDLGMVYGERESDGDDCFKPWSCRIAELYQYYEPVPRRTNDGS